MRGSSQDGTAEEWRRIGRRDWPRNKRHVDGDGEAAGFYLQQSLERSLKASLVSRGQPLRKIHALQALLDAAVADDPGVERFRPLCERVSATTCSPAIRAQARHLR